MFSTKFTHLEYPFLMGIIQLNQATHNLKENTFWRWSLLARQIEIENQKEYLFSYATGEKETSLSKLFELEHSFNEYQSIK